MGGTPFSNTQQRSHTMKFFAVIPAILAAAAAEAQLPIAAQYLGGAGLYNGAYGYAAPYAAAYAAPVATAVDAKFAYGAPVTALNAGPLTAGPVAAAPALAATAPIVGAQYAAAYTPAVAAAPAAYAPLAAPVAAPASSQYQAQDEFGNVAYGYQNINSAKQESGNAYGGVTGSYTYADEAGVHTVNYVADALGLRVAGDNLPVAPVHAAVAPVHAVAPVVDTPEVVEAKAAFFQAYEAAQSGIAKRSADAQFAYGYNAYPYAAYPYAASYAAAPAVAATYAADPVAPIAPVAAAPAVAATYAAAPVAAAPAVAATYAAAPVATVAAAPAIAAPVAAAYSAAPARDAVLTTIKLNPGHATFYRVD